MKQRFLIEIENTELDITVCKDGDDYLVTLAGEEKRVSLTDCIAQSGSAHALIDNHSYQVNIQRDKTSGAGNWNISASGGSHQVSVGNYQLAKLKKQMGAGSANAKTKILKAPMPGLVLQVFVEVGDVVKAGETVLVLEAMKMENPIKSIGTGTVSRIHVQANGSVDKGATLIEFADEFISDTNAKFPKIR